MINSIANFNTNILVKPVNKFNSIDAKNRLEKIRKQDGLEVSSLGIKATTVNLKDVQNVPLLIQIEKDFEGDFYSKDYKEDITLYDISSCSKNFPFELKTNQILSYRESPRLQVFDLQVKTNDPKKSHKLQIQVYDANDSILSPSIFEQTVLQGLLKLSDQVKDKLNTVDANTSYDFIFNMNYDSNSRTVDWNTFDKEIENLSNFKYDKSNHNLITKNIKDEIYKEILNLKSKNNQIT